MDHECLFALWYSLRGGCDELLNLTTNPDLKEFFHPGEIEILRRIMAVANEYHKIEIFIETATNTSLKMIDEKGEISTANNVEEEQPLRYGIYLMAFCSGLTSVLQDYLAHIQQLEESCLLNNQSSLVYILGAVEKYMTLFNTLNSIIKAIKVEGIYGCLLIGRLHNYIDCGISPIEKACREIVLSVNKMFYNQLANWLIFGNINDVYEEFFICDCNCDDEDFLYDWEAEKTTTTATTIHNYNKSPILKTSHKVQKFMIRPNLLPSMMLVESAESILFIGRMIWILQNDPRRNDSMLKAHLRNEIWSGNALEYVADIQAMEQDPFDRSRFEKKIGEYRGKLTKYLWTVMIDEANLLEHLQMIRDYYCLGRGELFQHFIVAAEEQLPEIPDNYIIKNLNYIFADTARQIYSSSDDSHTKFELVMPYHMTQEEYAVNPLGFVEMYFEVKWPLHVIFRPKVITLFNKVFTFLMRVKKTHIDLHQLWLKHMDVKKVDYSVWSLRHNLMFLVNNLQYYLQVDVIEAQFSILIQSIKNVNEYTDIVRMHSIFVSNLLSRTFVISLNQADKEHSQFNLLQLPSLDFDMKPKVYNIIICLLELCDSFCLLANNWGSELLSPERRQLEDIQHNLDTILENLFRALHSMHERVSGPHLLQLLHRLDFNRWFTKSKPDLNLSVA